jgi:propanediol dehydratase small subunit
MKTVLLGVIILIGVIGATIQTILERRRLRAYWDRVCTGVRWRRRFPKASKKDIRHFLSAFVDALGFRQSRKLCFSPDDEVLTVYQALYPPKWTISDNLELEMLAESLSRDFGVDLVAHWRDNITLGDLFAITQANSDDKEVA